MCFILKTWGMGTNQKQLIMARVRYLIKFRDNLRNLTCHFHCDTFAVTNKYLPLPTTKPNPLNSAFADLHCRYCSWKSYNFWSCTSISCSLVVFFVVINFIMSVVLSWQSYSPKISIVPPSKSTREMRSIWHGKIHPQNAASLLIFGKLF